VKEADTEILEKLTKAVPLVWFPVIPFVGVRIGPPAVYPEATTSPVDVYAAVSAFRVASLVYKAKRYTSVVPEPKSKFPSRAPERRELQT
jgi:hypothetical protein